MRYQAYLRVLNDEASIRKLYEKTNVPGAVVKPLKARREGTEEVWWFDLADVGPSSHG